MKSDCHLAWAPMASCGADALVVLGAKVRKDGSPSGALQRRLDRVVKAFDLGLAPAVVCAGGKSWGPYVEAVVMRDYLVRSGIPMHAVLIEDSSHSTLANALRVRPILASHGFERVLVVTCPWHMHRSLSAFRRCGVQAHPLPAAWGRTGVRQHVWRYVVERACETLDVLRFHWEWLR